MSMGHDHHEQYDDSDRRPAAKRQRLPTVRPAHRQQRRNSFVIHRGRGGNGQFGGQSGSGAGLDLLAQCFQQVIRDDHAEEIHDQERDRPRK
jgi:hypothetical protein